jgi:chloride channel protein, CIC family
MPRSHPLIDSVESLFRKLYFTPPKELDKQFSRFTRGEAVLILIAVCIGAATGGVIVLFNWAVEFAGEYFLELFALSQRDEFWQFFLIPLVPAFGGLLVGLLHTYVFRFRSGHGVPEVILASRFSRGRIPKRVILQKLLTGALSIGSGGGGGREGPIVHVGAAVGAWIAKLFRLTQDQSRTLIACGAAAGISGIFNAPLGGVMFVLEVILGDFRLKTFTPVVVASVTATALTRNVYGSFTLLNAPSSFSIALPEYLLFALLGIVIGLAAMYFTRVIVFVESLQPRLASLPAVLRPAAGGLLAGVFIMFLPELMEQTYRPVNQALHASLPIWLLLTIALLKPWHTAVTTASGGTGGVFAPALKSGAALGAAFGMIMMMLFPALVQTPTAYALAGMGAILAGTMHAPLTGILILIELSSDYGIVLPAMLTSIIATIIAQRYYTGSIYTWSLQKTNEHIGSYAYVPLPSAITIRPIVKYDVPRVSVTTSLHDILVIFEQSKHDAILVLDEEGCYKGLMEFDDVRGFITEHKHIHSLLAADIMITSIKPVKADTTLDVVLRLFDDYGWTTLPVISPIDSTRAIGIITANEAQTLYRRSVTRER